MADRIWRLTVWGSPRTKKNSNRLVRAGKRSVVLPSKAWSEWVRDAEMEYTDVPDDVDTWSPLDRPVNCQATFYRDARRGDACGFYQGLADLLEKRHVVENDSLIVSWDGSRMLLDRENPRVEIELTEVAA